MFSGTSGGNYCKVKLGQWVCEKLNKSSNCLTGKITKVIRRDGHYEDKPTISVNVTLEGFADGEPLILIPSFNMESSYSVGFFMRIHKIDLSKPMDLGASHDDKYGKANFCWMRQSENSLSEDGNKIKKDTALEYLRPTKKTFGTTNVYDYSKLVKYADAWIKKLNNPSAPVQEEQPPPPGDDDLPF